MDREREWIAQDLAWHTKPGMRKTELQEMKIAFFQALVAGLLLLVAPIVNTPSDAQVNNPQFTSQQYGNPPFSLTQNNVNPATNQLLQQARIPRYPLHQNNGGAAGISSSQGYQPASVYQQPSYPQVNRNAIQQPQFYGNQGVNSNQRMAVGQNRPAPRVFTPNPSFAGSSQQTFNGYGSPVAPSYNNAGYNNAGYNNSGFNNVPHVANNYGYGFRPQDQAPGRDIPSPSNLPIPGGILNPGNVENLQPAVQPQNVAPTVQQPMPNQQGVPSQQLQSQQQQQMNGVGQPYMDNSGNYYPQPGFGNMGPAYGDCGTGGCGNGSCYDAGFGRGCGRGCRIRPCFRLGPGCWFGSIGGLVLFRDYEDDHVYAYPAGSPLTNSLVSTQADNDALGGVELSFGRRFCNGLGIGITYWGLYPDDAVAATTTGNPQTQWQTANRLNYNVSTMDAYLNAALAYRISRRNEFHNIEFNLLRQSCCGYGTGYGVGGYGNGYGGGYGAGGCGGCGFGCGRGMCGGCNTGCGGCGDGCSPCGDCCPQTCCLRPLRPFRFEWLAGIRFFRFDENLFFEASTTGDYVPNINDMNYNLDVTNDLIGLQVGGDIEYCLGCRWAFVLGTRLGVYANSITQTQQIYGPAGYGVPNTGAWAGQAYNHRSTKEDLAFMGQFDIGLRYRIGCRWGVGLGYRVLSASGMALAPEQIPYDFADYQEVNYINSNSSLLLHGAYFRVEYNY